MSDSTLVQFRVAEEQLERWDEYVDENETVDSRSQLIRTSVESFMSVEESPDDGISEENLELLLDEIHDVEEVAIETRDLSEKQLNLSVTPADLDSVVESVEDILLDEARKKTYNTVEYIIENIRQVPQRTLNLDEMKDNNE